MTHPLFGQYTVQKYPYRIRFADGTEYNKREAEYMAKLPYVEKINIHQIKNVFGGEIVK